MSLAAPQNWRRLLKRKAQCEKPLVSLGSLPPSENAFELTPHKLEHTTHVAVPSLWIQPVVDTVTSCVAKLSVVRPESATTKDWQLSELQSICGLAKRFEIPCVTLLCASHDFSSPKLLSVLETFFLISGLSPETLEIAVPESFFVGMCSEAQQNTAVLKGWGVGLAIYNFGSHIAPLSCLESAHVAAIMLAPDIAERLSAPLKNPHYPLALTRAVNEAASLLDISVIATGIRSFQQYECLKLLGCHFQQGHFFVAPGHVNDLDTWERFLPCQEAKGAGRVRN